MGLKDRVVVITGGGRGIGREIALHCAIQGAKVVIASRSENELLETASLIKEKTGNTVHPIRTDVTSSKETQTLIEKTEKEIGPVYGLICAAGVHGAIGPFADQSVEEWEKVISINLMGAVRATHAVLKKMQNRKEGRVILFSGGGEKKFPNFSAYVASKGAIWRFTETVAAEVLKDGVYVNAIAPGAVNTQLLENVLNAGPEKVGREEYEKAVKQKETGGASAEKAAKLVLYLLGEKSQGLSGKVLSALWDDYEHFTDTDKITQSDLYNFRRITP